MKIYLTALIALFLIALSGSSLAWAAAPQCRQGFTQSTSLTRLVALLLERRMISPEDLARALDKTDPGGAVERLIRLLDLQDTSLSHINFKMALEKEVKRINDWTQAYEDLTLLLKDKKIEAKRESENQNETKSVLWPLVRSKIELPNHYFVSSPVEFNGRHVGAVISDSGKRVDLIDWNQPNKPSLGRIDLSAKLGRDAALLKVNDRLKLFAFQRAKLISIDWSDPTKPEKTDIDLGEYEARWNMKAGTLRGKPVLVMPVVKANEYEAIALLDLTKPQNPLMRAVHLPFHLTYLVVEFLPADSRHQLVERIVVTGQADGVSQLFSLNLADPASEGVHHKLARRQYGPARVLENQGRTALIHPSEANELNIKDSRIIIGQPLSIGSTDIGTPILGDIRVRGENYYGITQKESITLYTMKDGTSWDSIVVPVGQNLNGVTLRAYEFNGRTVLVGITTRDNVHVALLVIDITEPTNPLVTISDHAELPANANLIKGIVSDAEGNMINGLIRDTDGSVSILITLDNKTISKVQLLGPLKKNI